MSTILNVLRPVVRSVIKPIDSRGVVRFVYNMDGIDDRFVLANRAINPDGDIDVEFYTPLDAVQRTIIAQNISTNVSLVEFHLFISGSTGNLGINVGGSVVAAATAGTFTAGEKLRLTLSGTNLNVYKADGTLLKNTAYTRGTARESTAVTTVGARTGGSIGTYSEYFRGMQRDVKINGTLWPMADRNQSIQLPEPSGLGAELITQSVLENPAVKGSQWAYLGAGRWQYVGDGTLNELRFIPQVSQPVQGFLEFEVESVTGNMACTNDTVAGSIFNTVGVKRFFYIDNNLAVGITFKRISPSVATCIIKNISFKPLGTCNPMTGANLNPDRWVEIPK